MSMSGRCTPILMQLVYSGQENEVKQFLEKTKKELSTKAPLDDPNYVGRELKKIVDEVHERSCAVRVAVEANSAAMLELLYDAGANLDIKMSGGRPPLEYAKAGGLKKVVAFYEKLSAVHGDASLVEPQRYLKGEPCSFFALKHEEESRDNIPKIDKGK